MDEKGTTIISADYMYLIFLGNKNIISKIVNKLNIAENNKSTKYKNIKIANKNIYIMTELSNPCIDILETEQIKNILSTNKKYIIMDDGVETAQCLTYADISESDSYNLKRKIKINADDLMMIMVLFPSDTHYKLSYPILHLDEEENPDKLVSKWLSDHDISKADVSVVSIEPVKIVGKEHDILVFSAFVNE
jgi:hypothetical protein